MKLNRTLCVKEAWCNSRALQGESKHGIGFQANHTVIGLLLIGPIKETM